MSADKRREPHGDRPATPAEVFEKERLAALESYKILDTDPEQAFDDVVEIARDLCLTRGALVSLVAAERQWFKAKVGIDVRETPIDQSVCAHGLGESEMLVIPDLAADPRTQSNPLVLGDPHLRFYAGVVLRSPEGEALGTLCVIDDAPRPEGLTDRQTGALKALGRQVMSQLDMRKALVRGVDEIVERSRIQRDRDAASIMRQEQELKLRLAIAATRMGIFDYDLVSGELHWDDRVRELFGISSTAPVAYDSSFLAGVHPDDREGADKAVKQALDPKGPGLFEHEYRTVAPDGTIRWLSARGQTIVENGAVLRFVGAVRDVTARKTVDDQIASTLDRYRLVSQVTKDVIWDWDLVSHHVTWNEALTVVFGHKVREIDPTPEWWLGQVHPDDRERVRADIFRVIDGSELDWSHEYRFRRADGSWADVYDRGSLIRHADGRPVRMIGAMFDDSARKAEEQRQKLLSRELSHRMKNLLTMVQAIAGQTLRAAGSMDEARDVLAGRLVALSTAHEILLLGRTEGAPLARIVDDAVRIHIDAPDRLAARGPVIEIGAAAALPIILMLHELATNASKYGALSNDQGRIEIEWSVSARDGEETLRLVWTERLGPPVEAPSRKGFGARLIERGLASQLGGAVSLDFPADGVICALEVPLSRLREPA